MDNVGTFLLVEDNEDDALLIRRSLLQARVLNRLIVVTRAEEAVEYFLGQGRFQNRVQFPLPDLVLLDLGLPGISGLEFLAWLRSQPEFANVRVTVVTSSKRQQEMDRALKSGAEACLVKPLDFEKFAEFSRALNGYFLWLKQPPGAPRPEVVTSAVEAAVAVRATQLPP